MIDRNIGNSAIAQADARRQAREDAQDAMDAQRFSEGRELLRCFPQVATARMLHRLVDLGDEPNPSTEDVMQFLLDEFRAGSLRARRLMQRLWAVAADYPELLPEDPAPLERAKFLSDYVERLR